MDICTFQCKDNKEKFMALLCGMGWAKGKTKGSDRLGLRNIVMEQAIGTENQENRIH